MIAEYRPAMIEDGYALLPIGPNAERGTIKIDLEYLWLEQYTWVLQNMGYAKACIKGVEQMLHRLITKAPAGVTVDHINRDTLDNRLNNLRLCSLAENNYNKPAQLGAKSGFKGVEYAPKLNKYRARIALKGIRYNLGCFETAELAAIVYNNKAKELFGQYAYLNEIKYEKEKANGISHD